MCAHWAEHPAILVLQNGEANVCDLWQSAVDVEDLAKYNLEDLLYVDGVGSRAEDERCLHGPGKLPRLRFTLVTTQTASGRGPYLERDLLLVILRNVLLEEIVLGANQERLGSLLGSDAG